jgi:hypothetical protein
VPGIVGSSIFGVISRKTPNFEKEGKSMWIPVKGNGTKPITLFAS